MSNPPLIRAITKDPVLSQVGHPALCGGVEGAAAVGVGSAVAYSTAALCSCLMAHFAASVPFTAPMLLSMCWHPFNWLPATEDLQHSNPNPTQPIHNNDRSS